jgi:hypothetical protein
MEDFSKLVFEILCAWVERIPESRATVAYMVYSNFLSDTWSGNAKSLSVLPFNLLVTLSLGNGPKSDNFLQELQNNGEPFISYYNAHKPN